MPHKIEIKSLVVYTAAALLLVALGFFIATQYRSPFRLFSKTGAPSSAPKGIGTPNNSAVSVAEMCELLNTSVIYRFSNGICEAKVDCIEIKLSEICEMDLANKIMPAKHALDGSEIDIIYQGILIEEKNSTNNTSQIDCEHICAINKLLRMFAGTTVNQISIVSRGERQDRKQKKLIRDTLKSLPPLSAPICLKNLQFWHLGGYKILPEILYVVLKTLVLDGVTEYMEIPVCVDLFPLLMCLLSDLRCSKLHVLRIILGPCSDEAGMSPVRTLPRLSIPYDICNLDISSDYMDPPTIPASLIGKPEHKLHLSMILYDALGKEEVESIRAHILLLQVSQIGEVYNFGARMDARKRDGVRNTNPNISEVHIQNSIPHAPRFLLTTAETVDYIASGLAWTAAQFPKLSGICLEGFVHMCRHRSEIKHIVSNMDVDFAPKLHNLKKLMIENVSIYHGEEDRKVEYISIRLTNERDAFSSGVSNMPFAVRPRLWKALASGQIEARVNSHLKAAHPDATNYIELMAVGVDTESENFLCTICYCELPRDDDISWIYVTQACRHAFCLECMFNNFEAYRRSKRELWTTENTKCMLHNTPLLENWRNCWIVEELEGSEIYTIAPGCVYERKKRLVVTYE